MKATGVIRRVDELGRIVIPMELRKTLKIEARVPGKTEGDPMEVFVDGESIILKKYQPGCEVCGSLDDVHTVLGKKLCKKHLKEIGEFAKAVK